MPVALEHHHRALNRFLPNLERAGGRQTMLLACRLGAILAADSTQAVGVICHGGIHRKFFQGFAVGLFCTWVKGVPLVGRLIEFSQGSAFSGAIERLVSAFGQVGFFGQFKQIDAAVRTAQGFNSLVSGTPQAHHAAGQVIHTAQWVERADCRPAKDLAGVGNF